MEANYDTAWAEVVKDQVNVSPELGILVPAVCRAIDRRPLNLEALRGALEELLTFLASPTGRTDTNCTVVDGFFCMPEEYGWHDDWAHLPAEYRALISELGLGLHDTVRAPQIADSMEATPEHLLRRLRERC